MKTIQLDIPWDGDATRDGAWRGYDGIQAEGSTLEECLDNASVFLIDQDGGECGYIPADSDAMQAAVKHAWEKKHEN